MRRAVGGSRTLRRSFRCSSSARWPGCRCSTCALRPAARRCSSPRAARRSPRARSTQLAPSGWRRTWRAPAFRIGPRSSSPIARKVEGTVRRGASRRALFCDRDAAPPDRRRLVQVAGRHQGARPGAARAHRRGGQSRAGGRHPRLRDVLAGSVRRAKRSLPTSGRPTPRLRWSRRIRAACPPASRRPTGRCAPFRTWRSTIRLSGLDGFFAAKFRKA